MRLFIAALLPPEIQGRIDEYIKVIRPHCEGVKWEKRDKLHVTIKFMGDVEETMYKRVSSVLSSALEDHSLISMEIQRFGGFPILSNPRVLYVGLSDNPSLNEIQQKIENALETLGFEKERRKFTPHVTIGRIRNRMRLKGTIPPPDRAQFVIKYIALMRSVIGREGSVYTPLEIFRLS